MALQPRQEASVGQAAVATRESSGGSFLSLQSNPGSFPHCPEPEMGIAPLLMAEKPHMVVEVSAVKGAFVREARWCCSGYLHAPSLLLTATCASI
ncbi:hypothetical protein E2C01_098322 [Portunus trituberculatus]|uniref:Uncharacterized protein n=1 Tax=Portunus trituberculatus TaxID=210409 RepID=A0A5B7K7Y9_PORTR|nr:hypothetical protein [Portunus trituberculatus]